MDQADLQGCISCGAGLETVIDHIWDDRYGCPGVFAIKRCVVCGQMATIPRLKEEDLPALYSQYYPRRNIDFSALEKEVASVLAPRAGLNRWLSGTDNQGHYLAKPSQKVLDIGSGSCLALLELRAMGVEAWGVEADPNVRAIADRYNLRVHIGSIHDKPFETEKFDLIVLNQVIEHVPDPRALLRIVKERLSPGGRIVLSFPNVASWQRKLSGRRWINWHVPYHQHHFTLQSFTILAKREGLSVIKARTITPNLWTLLQIKAMSENPSEGQASCSWGSIESGSEKGGLINRIGKALGRRMGSMASVFLVVVNRLVDAVGGGDSLLIELSNPVSDC